MPTYEYRCSACGHKFEKFQSIKADPIKQCPACKKNKAERLIGTGAGLIFKGSGFYITDYRSDSYKQKAQAESGAGGESKKSGDTGSGGSSDSKPAAKTDAASSTKSEPKPAPKAEPKPDSPKKKS